MPLHFSLAVIAAIIYGLSRQFSRVQGDYSGKDWDALRPVDKQEWTDIVEDVNRAVGTSGIGSSDEGLFAAWSERLAEAGWKHGAATSRDNLTHRWLVPWKDLPETERLRWELIHSTAFLVLTSVCGPESEEPDKLADSVDEFLEQEAVAEKAKAPAKKSSTGKSTKPKSKA